MTPQPFNSKPSVKVRIREFSIPPVIDGLVIGRQSPIGCIALRRALGLLMAPTFDHIEIDDEIISDILVKQSLLQRISRECLVELVLHRAKPLMGPEEIMNLELSVEIVVEGEAA